MVANKTKPYLSKNSDPVHYGNLTTFKVPVSEIVDVTDNLYNIHKLPLKFITATDERESGQGFKVYYIFDIPGQNAFIAPYIVLSGTEEFPTITTKVHQAWNYERKIHTFFGLTPTGHPDLRPAVLHENWPATVFPLRKDTDWRVQPADAQGKYEFQKVEGEGIYEIPVGPIHAGIIEPGHFRFSMAGEEILLLEPKLGYVHKGSEKLFEVLPLADKIRLSEKISGDSSFSHSLTFCQALERLADLNVPSRATYLRVIYAELERLANHFGDIGAIMLDTGFNFGGAHGARIREMVMQLGERLTGSRFLRGVNTIGGVTKDLTPESTEELLANLKAIMANFSEVIEIANNSITLINRLKDTGRITREKADNHEVVGVAGRAVGRTCDARIDHPYAGYAALGFDKLVTEQSGDVYARFMVRVREVTNSYELIKAAIQDLPTGHIQAGQASVKFVKNSLAVSVVEGWRGDIVYLVTTDQSGEISRVAVRDPSFINWHVVEHAAVGNVIPDFPLINKSFNLSYTGYDL